jgi:DNA-directed RNA polymerase delta subunit
LKEKNQPLHFTQIAHLIDEYKLGKKKAHPQTVHNELIKDDRFVLIGRGIYALAEWGYSEGTIKDVIKEILAKSDRPLEKEEILKEVFRIRKVKKATVMINLNNSSIFEKRDNSYTIKR